MLRDRKTLFILVGWCQPSLALAAFWADGLPAKG